MCGSVVVWLCGCVVVCVWDVCGCVWHDWLCLAVFGCVSMCGCVRLCEAVCGCVRLCEAVCGCVWLCVTVCDCMWLRVCALCAQTLQRLAMFSSPCNSCRPFVYFRYTYWNNTKTAKTRNPAKIPVHVVWPHLTAAHARSQTTAQASAIYAMCSDVGNDTNAYEFPRLCRYATCCACCLEWLLLLLVLILFF